jgi:hypothetical protein
VVATAFAAMPPATAATVSTIVAWKMWLPASRSPVADRTSSPRLTPTAVATPTQGSGSR